MSNHGLNTWWGWRQYCDQPLAQRPEAMSLSAYRQLGDNARAEYDQKRQHFHANLPPLRHTELERAHDLLDLVRHTNPTSGYAARNALVVDGEPTIGKTTTVASYARQLDKATRKAKGDRTEFGRHRVPVVRVGLSGSPSMKDLSVGFAHFLGIPNEGGRTTRERLTSIIVDELAKVENELVILDDIHCVRPGTKDGADLADYFKRLADDVPGTCVFVGVNLQQRGFYDSAPTSAPSRFAQTSRRWTLVCPQRFSITTSTERKEWGTIVNRLAKTLVLLDAPDRLTGEEIELTYERTGGSLGSLVQLFTRAAFLAINSGEERLTTERLRSVPIDLGAHGGQADRAGEIQAVRRRATKGGNG